MTKRLLLAMAIGSVVLGCNKDSTVNRDDPSGGGEAGGGASGGALEGSGGGTTGGTGGATEASGGLSTGGSSSGGEGGDLETTGGEGGAAAATGGASSGGAGGEGGDAETTGGEGGGVATTGGEGGAVVTTGGDSSGGATTGGEGGGAGSSGGLAGGGASAAGAGTGGAGPGGAGGASSADATVRGRVIDFWGHALPGIRVEVSGTLTTTDNDGEFEVAEVPSIYDASLVVESVEDNVPFTHGWVYQDLTRRDPTLQVKRGYPNQWVPVEFRGENSTEIDEPLLGLSVAGPDGTYRGSTSNLTAYRPGMVEWHGPSATTATAHAVLMRLDPDTDFPTAYVAYDSAPVRLEEGVPPTVLLDLSPDELQAGSLLGTVSGGAEDPSHTNSVYARFPTGGSIELVREFNGQDSFSYLVPNLPEGSLTVAAEATFANGGTSVVHQGGLAAGSDPVALTLPTPGSLSVPAAGATGVDSTTPFRFVGSPDSDTYLVAIVNSFNTRLSIVTSREEFTLPEVLGGDFQLQPEDVMHWWVETHGEAGSVDELAAPDGFMDAFSFTTYPEPMGPRLGSGSYTASNWRSFTTAP